MKGERRKLDRRNETVLRSLVFVRLQVEVEGPWKESLNFEGQVT